jgi:hypothetical protein
MSFITNLRLLLIALWLGAAVYFIGVAQTAFGVLPERELAGAVVNRTLAILNYAGLIISLVVLGLSLIGQAGVKKVWLWADRFFLLIVAAACAVGQFVIAWWMVLLRNEMGKPIDLVPVEDPLRIKFNQMHEYSVWVLMTAMAAALIAFFIIAYRRSAAPPKDNVIDFDFQNEFKM